MHISPLDIACLFWPKTIIGSQAPFELRVCILWDVAWEVAGLSALLCLFLEVLELRSLGWSLSWCQEINALFSKALADGSTTRGRAGSDAVAALPIPTALLSAAANQGYPRALPTCHQTGELGGMAWELSLVSHKDGVQAGSRGGLSGTGVAIR